MDNEKNSEKLISMTEAVNMVRVGDSLTFSGFGHSFMPMAFVRELIRQKKGNLKLLSVGDCWPIDMLAGAGMVREAHFSCYAFEGKGRCRNFSRAVESGELKVEDYSHFAMTSRFVASGMGVPFMPVRVLLGSDILEAGSLDETKYKLFECPFSGEKILLVAALKPDVAVIHAHRADPFGNTQVFGPTSVLEQQVLASEKVIVTVDEIVSSDCIRKRPESTLVPGFMVDAVVEAPFGAHPAGMYRYYDHDIEHINVYMEASSDPIKFQAYLDKYVYNQLDQWTYLETIGLERLVKLRADPTLGYSPFRDKL